MIGIIQTFLEGTLTLNPKQQRPLTQSQCPLLAKSFFSAGMETVVALAGKYEIYVKSKDITSKETFTSSYGFYSCCVKLHQNYLEEQLLEYGRRSGKHFTLALKVHF